MLRGGLKNPVLAAAMRATRLRLLGASYDGGRRERGLQSAFLAPILHYWEEEVQCRINGLNRFPAEARQRTSGGQNPPGYQMPSRSLRIKRFLPG